MQFIFDEDTLLLQSTLRDFLAGECTPEVVRAHWESETGRSRELWKKLAEVGVPGLLVPEDHDGMGLDEIAMVLLQEEAGRAGLSEPVVGTAAVAVPLLVELSHYALAKEWLPRIAAGDAIVAVSEPGSPFVEDAHVADLLVLQHGDDVHAVAPGDVTVTEEPCNDPSRKLASVAWTPTDETRVASSSVGAALWSAAFDRGVLANAAQALGAADRLMELAVEYTSERKQFGQPIGGFQAVKHMLATVKVKIEYARPVVQRAAASVAGADPLRGLHVSMAKLAACDAAAETAKTVLQAHGAIGYTWEQDVHIWMRRAWSSDYAYGRRPFHEARVQAAVLDGAVPIGPGTTFQ